MLRDVIVDTELRNKDSTEDAKTGLSVSQNRVITAVRGISQFMPVFC